MSSEPLKENKFLSGISVPIAIVLVGALVIFGVTKMLSSERSYHDLLRDLRSKTFGNRWVAAYELAKHLNANAIDKEDIPEVVIELGEVFKTSQDPRTKDFVIVALGAVKSPLALPTFELGLESENADIRFHSLVALAELKDIPDSFNWKKVIELIDHEDQGTKHAAILCLASHEVSEAQEKIKENLADSSMGIRYAAAMGLLKFNDPQALVTIKEALSTEQSSGLSVEKIRGLKLNILNLAKTQKWSALTKVVKEHCESEKDVKIVAECLNFK